MYRKYLLVLSFLAVHSFPSILTAQWILTNGPNNGAILSFTVNDPNLYAGTDGGYVWKRPLSELVTSVPSLPNAEPVQVILGQNYPNPFNPTTSIRFYIPGTKNISIKIYDLLGREVRTLWDGKFSAGWHTVTWDGLDNYGKIIASNVYVSHGI